MRFSSYYSKVIQFPLVNCSSRSDCASCIGNSNPLCGWCVVENKCSRRSSCRNSLDSAHWIQAARPVEHCLTIMVSPEQYVVDDPQTVTIFTSYNNLTLFTNIVYDLFLFVITGYSECIPESTQAPR